jgi:hypothetical protein
MREEQAVVPTNVDIIVYASECVDTWAQRRYKRNSVTDILERLREMTFKTTPSRGGLYKDRCGACRNPCGLLIAIFVTQVTQSPP